MYTHTDTGVELLGHMSSIPRLRRWQPTPVFLPGKLHGQKSLAGYSPWGLSWTWLSIHIIVLRLIFWKASILFTTMAAPVYSPTKCAGFAFSPHPCQHLLFVFFFDDSQSDPCEEISHCGFDLHFPEDLWCWAPLHVPPAVNFLSRDPGCCICPVRSHLEGLRAVLWL